ncbi:MAG: hypothetical protein JSV38_15045 [Desulfobacterales bacterium]|nr:MAG: hypothetical protein JSV38_15045 [Desulfobacterales bacterium]
MKKWHGLIFTLFLVGLTPLLVSAGDFDGSAPLICAVIETIDCRANGNCQNGTADSINIPQFLKINFKSKTITGKRAEGEAKTTKIENMESSNGNLILQGTQTNKGWSIVIDEANGKMVLTASGDQVGFVVFGACAPL